MKQILEERGEPITNGAMKFQRIVQALEASFPDTEAGYNKLTAALHKLADQEEEESQWQNTYNAHNAEHATKKTPQDKTPNAPTAV